MSKQEKMALRRDISTVRQAKSNPFMKELLDDIEGRPEEVSLNICKFDMSFYIICCMTSSSDNFTDARFCGC